MTALRLAATAAVLLSALLGSVPARAQAYIPGVACSGGQAMTGYTPQSGIACGMPIVRSYLAGLTLSNDGASPTTVLDIAAGFAADSTNADMIALGSAFTKSTAGSWAAGSGANGMGAGLTVAASTWYHVFLIVNGGTADLYFDTSPSAANAPSGTSYFRRIGSFKTDGSAHILAFWQVGDEFGWVTPVQDVNTSSLGTTMTSFTLGSVPTGVPVTARFRGTLFNTAAVGAVIAPAAETGTTAAGTPSGNDSVSAAANTVTAYGELAVPTNGSAQIQAGATGASTTLKVITHGWIDRRGRDG